MSDNTVTMKSEDVLLDLLANRVSWPCLSRVDWTRQNWHNLQSVSDHITVYQQDDHQADVWTTLNRNKDDFLIYDRFVFKGKDWKNICVYLE